MNGQLLNNRYKINKIIGTGGMAIVYDGYDTILSRNVAIKILKDSYLEGEEFINKLKMEASTSASIIDDNIVSIYDVAATEINGKSVEYIVMEKIEGRTLKEIIQEEAPLTNEKILNYATQITKALQTAHIQGVIHRDIKPANILITPDDKVKVVDFGIARVSTEATITYTSSILGTVNYISPEQAKGQSIDSRSDLYSLGVVLFEMATGKVPFDGESPVSIAIKHIQEEPAFVSEINPDIDLNISNVIDKLLSKNPEDRYKTASNLLMDLNKIGQGHDIYFDHPQTVEGNVTRKQEKVKTSDHNEKPKVKYKSKTDIKSSDTKSEDNKKWILIPLTIILGLITIYMFSQFLGGGSNNQDPNLVNVPSVIDVSEETAIERLSELGFAVSIASREYDENIIEGNVISQTLAPQTSVERGRQIQLTISKGRELISIPDITGFNAENAESIIVESGFVLGRILNEESEEPEGTVFRQFPEANEMVSSGTPIDIYISKGVGQVRVPRLTGLDQREAEDAIRDAGLSVGTITMQENELEEGRVFRQFPEANNMTGRDTSIDLFVSEGPAETVEEIITTIVPDVRGFFEDDARAEIQRMNLFLSGVERRASEQTEGTVLEQSLTPQTKVEEDTVISLVISSGPEESEEETPQESPEESIEETPVETRQYQFNLQIPETASETFIAKIVNTVTNETVYERELNKANANSEGIIQVNLTDVVDSQYQIYYNNRQVEVNYE